MSDTEVYKRHWRSKSKGGFLTITQAFQIGKVGVDIGEYGQDGKLLTHTRVFASAIGLAVYLRAVIDGTAVRLYPENENKNITNEGFVAFGGAETDAGPVSRILKIGYNNNDTEVFQWKAGIFGGRKTESGAYLPNYKDARSENATLVPRVDMHEMQYRLDLSVHSYASRHPDWVAAE